LAPTGATLHLLRPRNKGLKHAVADSDQYAPLAGEDIDLDRVVMDPRYRRRIIERLRAEAALRAPSSNEPPPSPSATIDSASVEPMLSC
jgi:hypothetical protein